MDTARAHERVLRFLSRHERPLATILFLGGFITDLLTFGLLQLSTVSILFASYIGAVIALTAIAHKTYGKEKGFGRALSIIAPLFAQFIFGSLLSGFLILYTKSAVLSISWPFIILLIIIFFGNEVFRNYRSHLTFQTVLLYFSLFAYFVLAIPFYWGRIGTLTFLVSTFATIAAFALYLYLLKLIEWNRLRSALRPILLAASSITVVVVGSYLIGVLPPIPLTLKAGGIYQDISYSKGAYTAKGEQPQIWLDPRPQLVHHTPGTPLYAYSAIFAPGKFSTSVVHVWQRYNTKSKKWVTESTVAFPLSGGREGGYRGYTLKYDPQPGKWRVLVQTLNGQTIGDFRFNVENVSSAPVLQTQTF